MLSKNKSFTLVELLIVIIIVGILAAVAVPIVTQHIERAKWVDAVHTLGAIRGGCREYSVEFGEYPQQVYYLNGSNKSSNLPTSLQIDVPDPDSEGRYLYVTYSPASYPACAYAAKDDNGDGVWNGGEQYIRIRYDGSFMSSGGAPEF